MASGSATKHSFIGVCVFEREHCYVPALVDEMVADGDQNHTLVFIYDAGTWFHRALPFAVGEVCKKSSGSNQVLSMGIDGQVNIFTNPGAAGSENENIDSGEDSPSDLIPLRAIREIGQCVYACGMARHVYRRDPEGNWSAIDSDVFLRRKERSQAVGFNSIDGFDESSIFGVGYQGEIWVFDGQNWREQESPTNVAFTRVRCCQNGNAFAAGLAGVLLRRPQGGDWETIPQQTTEEDFWGMTFFKGNLYLSTNRGVFRLVEDELQEVDLGFKSGISTGYLDSNEEIMWSVGQRDIAETSDGVSWRRVPAPD